MKKLIKTLSFAALGILTFSLMAALLGFVYREPLLSLIYHHEDLPFVLPVGGVVALMLRMGAVGWICFCAGEGRYGVWAEILAAAVLAVVAPFFNWLLSWLQPMVFGRAWGVEYSLGLSGAQLLLSYTTALTGVAVALALLVCGMSIADKLLAKKNS